MGRGGDLTIGQWSYFGDPSRPLVFQSPSWRVLPLLSGFRHIAGDNKTFRVVFAFIGGVCGCLRLWRTGNLWPAMNVCISK